ncbi:MAG: hypothetical protein PHO85_00215 [Candidatus Cloacimonetes bacterium]|jgi:hypothetical protein|nr:hypothetical protein [Candidatus Cloacimonadota bacterium]MDD2506560.1 hypothetical protein [Candidatus Cloacimonadota bacterium]MDD4146932.1 hypothetical protein [Candidatus Cloacimonadota bacterium]MDD4560189.1 hypothetical protein [Candidatus Cloacimonadota bacterium]
MAKNNRGKTLRSMPDHGRGECPHCHRTGVKLMYEIKSAEKAIKVCKVCKSTPAEKLEA